MKKLYSLIIFIFFLIFFKLHAQIIPDEIITAFQKGNSSILSQYLNSNVELTINNIDNFYSKEQAELILKDFFNKNVVTSFYVTHKGEKNEATFFIGSLNTNKGIYRVTVFLKNNKNQKLIHHLRIEKKDE